ncbi:lectin-like protein [Pontiellaceae bacterium B12227]|nr:lectin-like protein [Pontiellaceae bacterium B12227]
MCRVVCCFFSGLLILISAFAQSNEIHLLPANTWDSNETHQVVWETKPGVRYELQESGSLTNWSSVDGYPATAGQYADAFTFNALSNAPDARFFKLVEFDEQPPEVADMSPGDGAFAIKRHTIPITATLSDVSGVDTNSIALTVGDLGTFSLEDETLSYTNGMLTFDAGGDDALGPYGSNVLVSLVAADVNGYSATTEWSFDLEVEPVVVSNLFVFGSLEAQEYGQQIGAIPARVLTQRATGGRPIRMSASADPWELQSVETNAVVISYTGTNAPLFEVGTKLANLTLVNIDDFFYRSITSVSNDAVGKTLTLFTDELLLTDLVENGSFSDLSDSVVLEVDGEGTIQRAVVFGGSVSLPRVGFSLDGSHFKVAEDGWEVQVAGITYTNGTLDGVGLQLTADEFHWWLYPSLHTALELNGFSLKRFKAVAQGQIDSALVLTAEVSGEISYNKNIFDLPEASEPSFPIITTIAGVPVRIDVSVDMLVDVDASAEAAMEIQFGISNDYEVAFGVHYENGEVEWTEPRAPQPETIPFDPSITSELGLGLTLKPRVKVIVYKCAGMATGPSIRGGASIRTEDLELSGWLEGSVIWDIETAGKLLDLLGIHKSVSYSIWEDEWKIFPESEELEFVMPLKGQVGTVGGTVSFTCNVSSPDPVTYQWFHNGTPQLNETSRTLTRYPLTQEHAGEYRVEVSSGGETINSTATLAVHSASLSEGLVAYYPFDGDAKDESGNGNDALVYGSPSFADNYLKLFDNTSNYLSLPSSLVDGRTAFSVSAKMRIDKMEDINPLLSGANGSDANEFSIVYLYTHPNIQTKQWLQNNGSEHYHLSYSRIVEDLEWHYISYVYDGNTIAFYFDGVLQETASSTEASWSIDPGGLIVGQEQDSVGGGFSGSQNWTGAIDDLRFYNRALSASEVSVLAGKGERSSYQIITGDFTWHEAKADAESRGGHLVTITSAEEWNNIVYQTGGPNHEHHLWIGATDEHNEGEWGWVTGEQWDYEDWEVNQPSGDSGLGHYAHILKQNGHSWNDIKADSNPSGAPGGAVIITGYLLEID